jgi:putative addiction module component (TIGR02574 family)
MSEMATKLMSVLSLLSAEDRAELAQFLIRSLDEAEDGAADSDAEAAWDAELARRMEEIKSGKAVGIPADQVFSALREKYS